MILERFETRGLAHYSYAVGDEKAGKIAIVDPRRDVDIYIDFAQRKGWTITHVLETHIHADYASGALELSKRCGAELCLSAYDEGELYEIVFPHRETWDGDVLEIGQVSIKVLHTPGHTPEHLSFLVDDRALLSGDFIFVGSVGRPDLLGEEAKQKLATQLYESLHGAVAQLPDSLEIYPAHGAGSMCGAGIGGTPSSTLGQERASNTYFDTKLDRHQFVRKVLDHLPPLPPYYKRMKELNSNGAPLLNRIPGDKSLNISEFTQLIERGATLIDLRDAAAFAAAHIPGALNIGFGSKLSEWFAWFADYAQPIVLIASPEQIDEIGRAAVRVGLDNVAGYLQGGMESWEKAARPVASLTQLTATQLQKQLADGEVTVLDVRSLNEFSGGHIQGAQHLLVGQLPQRHQEIANKGRSLVCVCESGYRSMIAASFLRRQGFPQVSNLQGGLHTWRQAGLSLS